MPGWEGFVQSASSVLPAYKSYLKRELVARSTSMWRASVVSGGARGVEILTQEFPLSIGQRLLDAGHLGFLADADLWDKLRLGLVEVSTLVPDTLRRTRCCVLCGGAEYGFSHLLAGCAVVAGARITFLSEVGAPGLVSAPAADWVGYVFSPHQPLARLQASVVFCARIAREIIARKPQPDIRTKRRTTTQNKTKSVCVCFLLLWFPVGGNTRGASDVVPRGR